MAEQVETNQITRRRILVGVFAGSVGLAVIGLIVVFRDPQHLRDLEPVAVYDSYYFLGLMSDEGQLFCSLVSHSVTDGRKRGTVYVQAPDGREFFIWELPEEVVSGVLNTDPGGRNLGGTYYCNPDSSSFLYINGRLATARIADNLKGFRIGPSMNGPFIELPMNRAKLLEVFGEPIEWRQRGRRATGA